MVFYLRRRAPPASGMLGSTLSDLELPPISQNRRYRRAPARCRAQNMPTRRASHQSRLVGVGRNTGTPDTTLEQWKRFAAAATPVANRALGAPPTAGSYQRRHFHTLNRLQLSVRTHQLSPAAQA